MQGQTQPRLTKISSDVAAFGSRLVPLKKEFALTRSVHFRNDAIEMGTATVPVAPVGVPPTGSGASELSVGAGHHQGKKFLAERRKQRPRRSRSLSTELFRLS